MKTLKNTYILFTWLLCLFLPQTVQAQSDCVQKIDLAYEKYNAGLFTEVLTLNLRDCLNNSLSFEEKSRIYKVLILVHLYRDQLQEAEDFMQELFSHDPEYPIVDTDPIEFETLHQRFDTDPVGILEFRTGANLTFPLQGNVYTVGLQGTQDLINYPKLGTQLGFLWEESLRKNWTYSVGLVYSYRAYGQQESLPYFETGLTDGFDTGGDTISFELTFDERQHWIDIPIGLQYNFMENRKDRLVPYISFGLTGHYLIDAKLKQLQRSVSLLEAGKDKLFEKRIEQITTFEENIIADFPLRTRFNLSARVGGGLQIKLGHNYLNLGMEWTWFSRNLVNATNRYRNDQLIYSFGYVDDDFIQISPQLNIGLKHIFYNPKIR